jgi:hypothetical protein
MLFGMIHMLIWTMSMSNSMIHSNFSTGTPKVLPTGTPETCATCVVGNPYGTRDSWIYSLGKAGRI